MRTIPHIRSRLIELAAEHGLPELEQLAQETRRRAPCRKAQASRAGLTEPLAARVQAYAAAHPRASFHDMANTFHTNIGRISEALVGRREEA